MKARKNRQSAGAAKTRVSRVRLAMVAVGFLAAVSTIGWRLVEVQVFAHEDYAERVREQRQGILKIPSRRGTIYDRHGEELALSVDAVSLYAIPAHVDDPKGRARTLAKVLERPVREMEARLRKKASFVWIARKISKETWKTLEARGFSEETGFGVLSEYRRRYPKETLASHVVGYVSVDDVGLGGVEYAFNEHLSGTPVRLVVAKRPSGRVALLPPQFFEEPSTGGHVTLTLDHVVQHYAERELDRIVSEHNPRSASIVVLVPDTGAVLAMASRPAANPNRSHAEYPEAAWHNAAIENAYEPGSVMKIFIAASALDEKLVGSRELIFCENGSTQVAGFRIRDHKPFATLSVSEIIAHSSNVGAIKIGRRFKHRETLYRRLRAFGFGAPSGIELSGESAGILRKPRRWSALSRAALSIGQEMSASALQLARATAVLANGGHLVMPYVVQESTSPDGEVEHREAQPGPVVKILGTRALSAIRHMMEEVVEYGTGELARVEGYTVAGKTGTAQKVDPATGRYAEGRYVASFAGFLPVEEPRAVIVVLVDEPSRGFYYASDVAAPAFSRLGKEIMLQLGVPPSFGNRVLTAAYTSAENTVSRTAEITVRSAGRTAGAAPLYDQ
ncbi:MAG: penicillin-binding protein 2 [Acidobacteriota bacterium]|nr:MAG: penicillin-binding protein 2 [Acidobacteriota bacterium]